MARSCLKASLQQGPRSQSCFQCEPWDKSMTKSLALIIEDDPTLNEIFALTLQDDFDLETCSDGNKALEVLGNVIPQIVILDLNIPGTSGKDILAHIRSDPRFQRTHVIV